MLPLTWFLFTWLILMAFFGLGTILTVTMSVRHGLSTVTTYLTTILFLAVIAFVVILTGLYLAGVDWSQSFSIFPSFIKPLSL